MVIPDDFSLYNSSSVPNSTTDLNMNSSSAPLAPDCPGWANLSMTTLIPPIYSIIIVLGIVSNTLAVIVLAHSSASRSVANTFMLNLCVADLLFLLSLPFWAVTYSQGYNWTFGRFACKICGALLHFNLYASIFFITCMSMDRYLAIVHPLRSQSARDPKRAKMTCAVVWILACLCSAPTLALRGMHPLHENVLACVVLYPNLTWYLTLAWMKVLLAFLFPLVIISCCYCVIGRHLLADTDLVRLQSYSEKKSVEDGKPDRPPTPSVNQSYSGGRLQEGRGLERVLWTIAVVVLAFFLCWFPFHCVTMLDLLKAYGVLDSCWADWCIKNLTPITLCLGFSNSAINPFLYCFIGRHFRGRLGGIWKGVCACVKARGGEDHHSQKRGSFSTRLSSFSRKLSDLKDLAIVESSGAA